MGEVEVRGIAMEETVDGDQPLLVLQERQAPRRCLLIWVGGPEAVAVTAASPQHSSPAPPRPLTHDLLLDVVEALDGRLAQVRITGIVADQFHAEIDLAPARPHSNRMPAVVPARASDAVTLAVHRGCPILVAAAVLDEAGLPAERITTTDGPDTRSPDMPTAGTDTSSVAAAEEPGPAPSSIEDQVEQLRQALSEATPDDFGPGSPASDPGEQPPE